MEDCKTARKKCGKKIRTKSSLIRMALKRFDFFYHYYGIVRPSLVANQFWFLENRGLSTFAGVFEQRNGRIGPAFLEVPHQPAIKSDFARGMQRRLPFLQDSILKNCRYTPVSSTQFRTRFI